MAPPRASRPRATSSATAPTTSASPTSAARHHRKLSASSRSHAGCLSAKPSYPAIAFFTPQQAWVLSHRVMSLPRRPWSDGTTHIIFIFIELMPNAGCAGVSAGVQSLALPGCTCTARSSSPDGDPCAVNGSGPRRRGSWSPHSGGGLEASRAVGPGGANHLRNRRPRRCASQRKHATIHFPYNFFLRCHVDERRRPVAVRRRGFGRNSKKGAWQSELRHARKGSPAEHPH